MTCKGVKKCRFSTHYEARSLIRGGIIEFIHLGHNKYIIMASFEKDAATLRVIAELKRLYKTKILPLEQLYKFDVFNSPHLTDAEFDSKPQVMLLGQYSVGKTTFIRYLLGADFPGQRIGPEPTTDRFTAIIDGPDERIIPGNALAVSHDMPYRGLERFGVAFLNRFEGSQIPNQVLKNITLIDTPGVLSGEKQRVARGYDFCQVCTWFASRADLIILLFDAHKLDISDEFRNAIDSLKGNDDKIRYLLFDFSRFLNLFKPVKSNLRPLTVIRFKVHFEQGRPGGPAEADARVRSAHVESGQGGKVPRGTARVHRLVLGSAAHVR